MLPHNTQKKHTPTGNSPLVQNGWLMWGGKPVPPPEGNTPLTEQQWLAGYYHPQKQVSQDTSSEWYKSQNHRRGDVIKVSLCVPGVNFCGQADQEDWRASHQIVWDSKWTHECPTRQKQQTSPNVLLYPIAGTGMKDWLKQRIAEGWQPFPTKPSKAPLGSYAVGYCAGSDRKPVTPGTIDRWWRIPEVRKAFELGNLGLRMPGSEADPQPVPCDNHPDAPCGAWMLGIDIDHKGDKTGGYRLSQTAERYGLTRLPAKMVHTSTVEPADAPEGWAHGHYLMRICGKSLPENKLDQARVEKMPSGEPMQSEIMRPSHRHMGTGTYKTTGQYLWVDSVTRQPVSATPPAVADIPQLTDNKWLVFLTIKPQWDDQQPSQIERWQKKLKQRYNLQQGYTGRPFEQWNEDHPWDSFLAGFGFIKVPGGWKAPGADTPRSCEINKNGRLVHWGSTGAGILGIEQFTGGGGLGGTKPSTYDQLDIEAIRRFRSNSQQNRVQVLREDGYLKPAKYKRIRNYEP